MTINNTIWLREVNSSTFWSKQRKKNEGQKILILCPPSISYHPYHHKNIIVANVYGATKYLVGYGKVLFEYSHRIQEQESCILKMKCICKCNLYLGAENYWILTAIPVIPYLFRLNLNWSLNTSAFIEMIVPGQKVIIIPYVTSKLNFFFL